MKNFEMTKQEEFAFLGKIFGQESAIKEILGLRLERLYSKRARYYGREMYNVIDRHIERLKHILAWH